MIPCTCSGEMMQPTSNTDTGSASPLPFCPDQERKSIHGILDLRDIPSQVEALPGKNHPAKGGEALSMAMLQSMHFRSNERTWPVIPVIRATLPFGTASFNVLPVAIARKTGELYALTFTIRDTACTTLLTHIKMAAERSTFSRL